MCGEVAICIGRTIAGAGAIGQQRSLAGKEAVMDQDVSTKPASGSDKSKEPAGGGDHVRKAQEWSGGSKGAKGPVTEADKANENSSAKS
jgi:hypothetical protein